jgi:CBS-domain-containing membrane protein
MSMVISSVMRTDFLALDAAMTIRHAAGLLHAKGQEAAPVLNEAGLLIGILTQKDCFRPAVEASYYQQWRGTVGEQMSSPVKTIEDDADIVSAAKMFLAEPHRSFPVLQSGQLVGMLRREDVLGRLLELG